MQYFAFVDTNAVLHKTEIKTIKYKTNSKPLMENNPCKCFLLPSVEYEKAFLREEGGPRSGGRSLRKLKFVLILP